VEHAGQFPWRQRPPAEADRQQFLLWASRGMKD
jgi:hypothetical protein